MAVVDPNGVRTEYEYDDLGRQITTIEGAQTANPVISRTEYDKNGNIKRLKRRGLLSITTPTSQNPTGANFGLMDDLTYTYNGNQLVAVNDAITQSSGLAGDFQDRGSFYQYQTSHNPSSHEYIYDANGHANTDRNREIENIKYNHLAKATDIRYENGNTLKYVYDAAGIKLYKISTTYASGVPVAEIRTDYVGGFVYQNSALQFIATSEGKALAPFQLDNESGGFVYEYNYTDHLGNLRMTFREAPTVSHFVASMETTEPQKTNEEREFANISLTRDQSKGRLSSSSAKLNATKQIGPWKSLPVRQGDQIDVEVFANYLNPNNQSFTVVPFLNFLNVNQGYGSQTINGETIPPNFPISNITGGLALVPLPNNSSGSLPSAYLYLIFIQKLEILLLLTKELVP
ncbi:RHS repeat protein [bacterium]|nr:RHS repeat protein [bacterium]